MVGTVRDAKLKEAMGNLCNRLTSQQEPLGEEFAQVLDDHRWELYETDDIEPIHPLINKVVEVANEWLHQKRHRREDLYVDVYVRGDVTRWVTVLHSRLSQTTRDNAELSFGDPDNDDPTLSLFVFSMDGKNHLKITPGTDITKVTLVQT